MGLSGCVGEERLVMGLVSSADMGYLTLEDTTGSVPLDMSAAEVASGLITGELWGVPAVEVRRRGVRIHCMYVQGAGSTLQLLLVAQLVGAADVVPKSFTVFLLQQWSVPGSMCRGRLAVGCTCGHRPKTILL
jgi:hypothetical protein